MIVLRVHPLSIPPLMMAGVVFYVGLSHVLLYRRRDQHVRDLMFALTCFGMGLYNLFAAGLYSAASIEEGIIFQRAQIATLGVTTVLFLAFVAVYTEAVNRRVWGALSGILLLSACWTVVGGPLALHADEPLVKHHALPVVGGITYYEVAHGPVVQVQSVVGLAVLAVALLATYRGFRKGHEHRTRRLLQALSILAVGAINDVAVGGGWYQAVYLLEYCYLAVVVVMTAGLTRELAASEATQAQLAETQKRFRSVFQNVSVGIGMTSPNGVFFEANAALTAMFGQRAELVGTSLLDHLHVDDAQRVRASLQDLLNGDVAAYRDEVRYCHPDGATYWGDISAGVQRRADGRIHAVTWIVIGITERREAVASVELLNEELEERIAARTVDLTDTNQRLSETLSQLESDERTAQMIQFSMLPPATREVAGVAFSHFLIPSELMSGDFIDYFPLGEGRAAFYMADVSGHGVSSAFVTVLVKGFFRTLREQFAGFGDRTLLDPAAVLTRLNRELISQDVGKHVTLIYGVLDTDKQQLAMATGGHFPHPVFCRDTGCETVPLKGPALGLFDDATFAGDVIPMPPSFLLAIFSDGFLDVLPPERLKEKQAYLATLVGGVGESAADVAGKVGLGDATRPADDATVLLMTRGGEHA